MTLEPKTVTAGTDDGENAELRDLTASWIGAFFDSGYFPYVGYNQGLEIDHPRRRREEHLASLDEMASRGEPVHSRLNLFTANSDWVTYHTVVSTSGEQMAIAPGGHRSS